MLVAKPKAGKSNYPTQSSYFSSKIAVVIFLVANCKRYPYFHPSIEYPWKMHWQRNMCREHLGTFSDMIRENDNSESCHVLFFKFF